MGDITLANAWTWLLAAAAAFVLLSGAIEKIVNTVKTAKAPSRKQEDEQNKRLDELEEWRSNVDAKLNRDNDRLGDIEAGNHATLRALLALLDHGIDGNNIKQMQHAKEELQEHLINR
jgi:hypothetical protein